MKKALIILGSITLVSAGVYFYFKQKGKPTISSFNVLTARGIVRKNGKEFAVSREMPVVFSGGYSARVGGTNSKPILYLEKNGAIVEMKA